MERARSLALFFAGFASGALSVAILLQVGGHIPASQASDRPPAEVEALTQARAHGIALPLASLRRSDLIDAFNQSRSGGRPHEATDIMAARGTPVLAVDAGIVRKLFLSKQGGVTIYQFNPEETDCYYYAHLDRYREGLKEGMHVQQGEVIGYVGSTGNASPNAPHLHFAIFKLGPEKRWWQGTPVNPFPLLVEALDRKSR